MFKKLKDKLAEEVKSSPQLIQLFASAAATSASSSVSDITNSDLFSIGDNDTQPSQQSRPESSQNTPHKMFQDTSLAHAHTDSTSISHETVDGQRQRRLSNSSFSSDVSFRLPSYETPSTYHLQSDMEVSASEAEERGFSGSPATFERVTKEQLYAAYKRTQERYKKYRTQYGDLARHYKLLERENAKARSVLVETQDKALRRISELKEQCALEQSAKAHLEKALRVEIEEKNMKIETLNTKVQLLQNNIMSDVDNKNDHSNKSNSEPENEVQLINLDNESTTKPSNDDTVPEATSLNVKIEKMEQLLNKYKESLKISKEKNSQITSELQIISKELENKNKQILDLKNSEEKLNEAKTKIQELINLNEELQNQVNTFDFTKTKELSTLELDLQKANEEIVELRGKIEVFGKREEEYAISLAENKLSIHKELESKEAEIKSLKENLSASKTEIHSLKIVIDDYKNNISALEEEKVKLSYDCAELNALKNRISEMDTKLQEYSKKAQTLEQLKTKADEEYNCLQLQLKQETAEKLAMIDRNTYLETKNTQLSEENTKKSTKISNLENEIQSLLSNKNLENDLVLKETENSLLLGEMNMWKEKCSKLELEIQEEREELVKLQTEIEKLLSNHELIQTQNVEFRSKIAAMTVECSQQQENFATYKCRIRKNIQKTLNEVRELKENIFATSKETKKSLKTNKDALSSITQQCTITLNKSAINLLKDIEIVTAKYNNLKLDYDNLQNKIAIEHSKDSEVSNELYALKKENNNLKIKLQENEVEKDLINKKHENTATEYESTLETIQSLNSENQMLVKTLKEAEETVGKIQIMLQNEKAQHITTVDKLKTLQKEKQNLCELIKTLESEKSRFETQLNELKQQHENSIDQLKKDHDKVLKNKEEEVENMSHQNHEHQRLLEHMSEVNNEKDQLNEKMKQLENKNNELISEIEDLSRDHKAAITKVKELNVEIGSVTSALEKSQHLEITKQELTKELKSIEERNRLLNVELEELKSQHKTSEDLIQELDTNFRNKSNEYDVLQVNLRGLQENINLLTKENILLKNEATNYASNINKLESEINEIKISHEEIEIEKDRLNKIIEGLESKQNESNLMKNDKDSQTETNNDVQVINEDTSAILENKWVMEHKHTMSSTASLNLKKENLEDLYERYSTLKINNDSLKEENRRLQSDIEGLQSYLTKISKENSVLNDKLREFIATSEHSIDNDQLSSDVKALRNEINVNKEKIIDLQRENSLLIEENLELKDQLQSQNYSKTVETKAIPYNEKEFDIIKVKYNDLLETNNNLEKQNMDLEQINKSVNSNMQLLQDKNERLKLSNEKLERRLDEALVSLRHLHSLQENTELEYLRNILYEYLTGSGTHSVTLAKVLAAIVKFDDVQTQMVLQKEKERQGFLRQLGII